VQLLRYAKVVRYHFFFSRISESVLFLYFFSICECKITPSFLMVVKVRTLLYSWVNVVVLIMFGF